MSEFIEYEGENRRHRQWHLEKSISVGHIITTLTVAFSALVWASHTDTRITVVENEVIAAKLRDEKIELYVKESVGRIEASVIRIEVVLREKADRK